MPPPSGSLPCSAPSESPPQHGKKNAGGKLVGGMRGLRNGRGSPSSSPNGGRGKETGARARGTEHVWEEQVRETGTDPGREQESGGAPPDPSRQVKRGTGGRAESLWGRHATGAWGVQYRDQTWPSPLQSMCPGAWTCPPGTNGLCFLPFLSRGCSSEVLRGWDIISYNAQPDCIVWAGQYLDPVVPGVTTATLEVLRVIPG